MSPAALPRLIAIVERHGERICSDAAACRAVLNDFPTSFEKRQIHALARAVSLGIPAALMGDDAKVPWISQRERLAMQLNDELGLDQELARWSVDTWKGALNVPTLDAGDAVGCSRFAAGATTAEAGATARPNLADFEATAIDGTKVPLSRWAGKVVLIVNTASRCGFTPQFAGLEVLWQTYKFEGFVVIGFPCNQFGGQDPGSDGEIASFCQLEYGVSFPMMAKIDVNGRDSHLLYQWLAAEAPGLLGTKAIKWNFTKFLVGKDGRVIRRYAPQHALYKLGADIAKALAA